MPISPCPRAVRAVRRGRARRRRTSSSSSRSAVADDHLRAGRARVLERVGQRLLHDPVRRQVDAGRQRTRRRPRRAARPAGRRRAASSTSASRPASPGCGASAGLSSAARAGRRAAGAARPAPRARSACDRRRAPGGRRSGSASSRPRPGLGLHDHHAEAVGDHVVQLARDPGALLGHGRPRLGLARLLGPLGALGQLGRSPVALVEGEADQPGDRRDRDDEHDVGGVPLGSRTTTKR